MRFIALLCTTLLLLSPSPSVGQYWQVTTGPAASAVCLATNSKGHVFAGTDYSKVYRTTDKGETWDFSDRGIDDGINFVTISNIKVGANDVVFASVNGLGVMRSTDDGQTWQKLNLGFQVSSGSRIYVDTKILAGGATSLFVGYDNGPADLRMCLSADNGETFVNIPRSNIPGATSALFEVFQSPNSDKLFVLVAYNKGLYRSTNKGASWTRIDSDPQSGESDDNFRVMTHDEKGHLYIGRNALPGSTRSKNAVVMKSVNDGDSWTYLTTGWDNADVTNNRVSGIAIGKNGEMWATTEKISGPFHSTNYGATWTLVREGLESIDGSANGVIVTKDNHVFVAPKGTFVHRHLDPASSVDELFSGQSFIETHPNPVRDQISVDLRSVVSGADVVIRVYSLLGTEALPSLTLPGYAITGASVHLNAAPLAAGTYTLVANIGPATVTKTFVKTN
jgi:photosystem II stability/assembly factor-like uncharacterized protein